MALMKCVKCGQEDISFSEDACPKCGGKVKPSVELESMSGRTRGIIAISVAAIGIILILYIHDVRNKEKVVAEAANVAAMKAQALAEEQRKEAEQKRVAALSPAQRSAEAKAAAKTAADEAQRKKFGEPPRRVYDKYQEVDTFLERSMGDPSSLKMGKCTEARLSKAGWLTNCSYRGKNAYGALVLESNWFVIDGRRVVMVPMELP